MIAISIPVADMVDGERKEQKDLLCSSLRTFNNSVKHRYFR
ncbi:hypothetical protein ACNARU_02235 [Proteus sp. WDL240414]|uniref:Uncharacterized protein n=1 Tax=Proteus genomosp. 6 TaxID=1311820 RepID=A0ABV1L7A9_9GAMM